MAARARQRGQGLAEYGLLLVLVAVVAVAAISAFGTSVSSLYSRAAGMF
jgi:pilus assembly protein Flp/PilA